MIERNQKVIRNIKAMGTTRNAGSLYTKMSGNLAIITFGHPSSNSFTSELLDRLAREFDELSGQEAVRAILLRSEGERAFCAGASFDELLQVDSLEKGAVFFSGFAHVINAMRRCEKIVVGRAQGKAVGGGVGLLSACDYVFAMEGAAIRLSELSIGIAPLVIAPAVARKMGTAALAELSLDPTNWKNAYWAKEKGLFARVFATAKDLDTEIDFFTQKLANYSPEALQAMKKALWANTDHWEHLLGERAKITGELVLSKTAKDALAKFKAK